IAAFRAERDLHRIVEDVDAAQHAVAGIDGKFDFLGSHFDLLRLVPNSMDRTQVITPMMSDSFMIRRSSPSSLTSVPDHLPNSTRSPILTSSGISLPASSRPPGPTPMISPWLGFS